MLLGTALSIRRGGRGRAPGGGGLPAPHGGRGAAARGAPCGAGRPGAAARTGSEPRPATRVPRGLGHARGGWGRRCPGGCPARRGADAAGIGPGLAALTRAAGTGQGGSGRPRSGPAPLARRGPPEPQPQDSAAEPRAPEGSAAVPARGPRSRSQPRTGAPGHGAGAAAMPTLALQGAPRLTPPAAVTPRGRQAEPPLASRPQLRLRSGLAEPALPCPFPIGPSRCACAVLPGRGQSALRMRRSPRRPLGVSGRTRRGRLEWHHG